MKKIIAYLRTSTAKKIQTGLDQNGFSFESQLNSIKGYAGSIGAEIVDVYSEQVSGANNDRPQLNAAFAKAKQIGCDCCVVVAKVDRLSRDSAFVIQLSNSGVPFRIAELPNADHLQLSLMAVLAEAERRAIKQRVKSAMAAAKAKGVKFGTKNPELCVKAMNAGARKAALDFKQKIKPIIDDIINVGGVKTLQGIANALNARGIKSRTNSKFYPTTVKNLMACASSC
jgi:DNA invertase Pin-like site-specific DNA recombinase